MFYIDMEHALQFSQLVLRVCVCARAGFKLQKYTIAMMRMVILIL